MNTFIIFFWTILLTTLIISIFVIFQKNQTINFFSEIDSVDKYTVLSLDASYNFEFQKSDSLMKIARTHMDNAARLIGADEMELK